MVLHCLGMVQRRKSTDENLPDLFYEPQLRLVTQLLNIRALKCVVRELQATALQQLHWSRFCSKKESTGETFRISHCFSKWSLAVNQGVRWYFPYWINPIFKWRMAKKKKAHASSFFAA